MKYLVIVESPSKSKTIEKYLGKDYKVLSSKGHIRDLATSGKEGLGVDIENHFKPAYVVSVDKKQTLEELRKQAKKADFVYLATDPDREGEAISWHLADELGLPLSDKNRIVFNEITRSAVLQALDDPRSIDMDLVKSQETRRILDRIIGFKLSKLLKQKINSKSAGRVQSIALRMICDREKEIEAFKPEEYWTITAHLLKGRSSLKCELSKVDNKKAEIHNEEEADKILSGLGEDYIVSSVVHRKKKRSAFLPFITSTMQQEASSKLGFPSRKTMQVAQSLYEGVDIGHTTQGLITYMRTDSTRLSKEFIASAYDLIEKEYGKEYKGFYRVKNDESSQDAHEAIRPTSLENDPESIRPYLTNDQYKLYRFIYNRALSSLMADAVFDAESVSVRNNSCTFTISGSEMIFDGWLKVYNAYDSSKDVILPELNEGESLKCKEVVKDQHFTEAPSRYTEARLIKALEEEGVGRPSTYAMIIDTIQDRGYVELKKSTDSGKTKFFYPTKQGILTDEKLREYFSKVINVRYTADMEKELDDIASEKTDSEKALKNFYIEFDPLVKEAYQKMEKLAPEKTGEKCPNCGGDLVIRSGRYGKFISCSNYPRCRYHASLEEPEDPVDTGRKCPECGGALLKRKSRYGNYFIGCANYPKCNYVESIPGEKTGRRYTKRKSA